jgi:hypothetical protein
MAWKDDPEPGGVAGGKVNQWTIENGKLKMENEWML